MDSLQPSPTDLIKVLEGYWIGTSELETGGGGRTPFTARFDDGLERQGWGKRNISISKLVDGKPITRVRGHEIDMFAVASDEDPYPGIGCEMEWNNKDPFYDRDLLNFQALHHEGVLAVGIIVTRGPGLQRWLERAIWNQDYTPKYGKSTTHWNKLVPRVNLGGGGECPLILVGIEAARVTGRELHDEVVAELDAIEDFRRNWRDRGFDKWSDAKREYTLRRKRQIDRLHDR
ncbi:BglII/BstYI family type II restriction endonuclease [Ornithinimicrobium sp. Y1694]|uniref:BglII/BstYI family type II restriction endonuclease n=1 Tax=Ornithinimicrobium sp. Y1694 TaxID=3418590 RepID=UPI003CFAABB6